MSRDTTKKSHPSELFTSYVEGLESPGEEGPCEALLKASGPSSLLPQGVSIGLVISGRSQVGPYSHSDLRRQ